MATVRTAVSPSGTKTDLATHNEELLRIVEKQRIIINNLQKSLAIVTDERDNLLERNQDLEQEVIMATQLDVNRRDPSSTSEESDHKQQKQQQQQNQYQQEQQYHQQPHQQVQQEPKKEAHHLLAETIEATMLGPVPPPRSPYRAQQKDSIPSPSSTNSSSSNLVTSSVLERYGSPDSAAESRMGATLVEPSLPSTYAYDNRSRAASPSPSPSSYQQHRSHGNNNNNGHSTPSNYSNGSNHMSQQDYHDNGSAMKVSSSSRNVSPSPTNNYNQQQEQQQHVINGNGSYNNGSNIELPESFSNSSLELSLPPVVDAMVDKDAQTFAKYQGAVHRKESDSYQQQPQQQNEYYQYSQPSQQHYSSETMVAPAPGRKPVVDQQSHYPLSPVEQNNTVNNHYRQQQQQQYNSNYQYQQQQQQNHPHNPRNIPPQIQVDHHRYDNYTNRPGEDHVEQRHLKQSETAGRNTRIEQEPATPTTPNIPQQPSSPHDGGFSSGPMAGINTRVIGSDTIRNDKGKEVVTFTISVRKATDTSDPNSPLEELWQIQKLYSDFLALDAQV